MDNPNTLTFEQKVAKSSQVLMVEFDPMARELRVVFEGTPAIYAYLGVSPDLNERLLLAESIGSFLHQNVKKAGYSFDKRAMEIGDYQALVEAKAKVRATIQEHDGEKTRLAQAT